MRRNKTRYQQQDKNPFSEFFKVEAIVEPVNDKAYSDHDDIFDERLQRRHGNGGAKAAAIAVVAGGSHDKDQVNAKYNQGDHREFDGKAPDV